MATKLAAVDLRTTLGVEKCAQTDGNFLFDRPESPKHIPLCRTDTPRPIAFGPPPDDPVVSYGPIRRRDSCRSDLSPDTSDNLSTDSISSLFRVLFGSIHGVKKRVQRLYSSVNSRYPIQCLMITATFILIYSVLALVFHRCTGGDELVYDGPPINRK